MANTIRLKRSSMAGKAPAVAEAKGWPFPGNFTAATVPGSSARRSRA